MYEIGLVMIACTQTRKHHSHLESIKVTRPWGVIQIRRHMDNPPTYDHATINRGVRYLLIILKM